MSVKLLTEHNLEFLSLKGGCTGSSESTLVKMPHCWKSHVAAQFSLLTLCLLVLSADKLSNSLDKVSLEELSLKPFSPIYKVWEY